MLVISLADTRKHPGTPWTCCVRKGMWRRWPGFSLQQAAVPVSSSPSSVSHSTQCTVNNCHGFRCHNGEPVYHIQLQNYAESAIHFYRISSHLIAGSSRSKKWPSPLSSIKNMFPWVRFPVITQFKKGIISGTGSIQPRENNL